MSEAKYTKDSLLETLMNNLKCAVSLQDIISYWTTAIEVV